MENAEKGSIWDSVHSDWWKQISHKGVIWLGSKLIWCRYYTKTIYIYCSANGFKQWKSHFSDRSVRVGCFGVGKRTDTERDGDPVKPRSVGGIVRPFYRFNIFTPKTRNQSGTRVERIRQSVACRVANSTAEHRPNHEKGSVGRNKWERGNLQKNLIQQWNIIEAELCYLFEQSKERICQLELCY